MSEEPPAPGAMTSAETLVWDDNVWSETVDVTPARPRLPRLRRGAAGSVALCGLVLGSAVGGFLISRTADPVATVSPSPGAQLPEGFVVPHAVPGVDLLRDTAGAIGISEQALEIGLQSGQTIALVAVVNGGSAGNVIAALESDETSAIRRLVASGTVTSSQAGQMRSQVTTTMTDFAYQLPATGLLADGSSSWEQAALQAAAAAIGISAPMLQSDLVAGLSIAGVAAVRDVGVESVIGAVSTAVENQISDLYNSGQLTPDQASSLTVELEARVGDWVSGASPGSLLGPFRSGDGEPGTGASLGPSPSTS